MKYTNETRALSLDMAETTGWASLANGVVDCGLLKLKRRDATQVRPRDHEGKRLLDFEKWLHATIRDDQPKVIFYEEAVTNKPNTARMLYGYRAILMSRAAHWGLPCFGCHIGTVKKFATGCGNAKKPEMLATARALFPTLTIADDNAADALHVLKYGIHTHFEGHTV